MSPWLLLVIIGVVLAILGFSGIASWLIWVGIVLLIVGLVLTLVRRA